MDGDGVDAGEWFVEEDDPRLGDQAAGDLEPPLLAPRDVVCLRAADLHDVELLEEFLAPLSPDLRGHADQFHDRQEVLLDGELAKHTLLLGEVAHAAVAGPLVHRPVGDLLVVEEHTARVGDHDPAGHAEAGGLAGAVGAEQADDFAGLDVEVDTVDNAAATVVFDEAFDAQKRHPCHSVGAGRGWCGRPAGPL